MTGVQKVLMERREKSYAELVLFHFLNLRLHILSAADGIVESS